MKRLMTVLAAVSPVLGGFAADYFNVGTDKGKDFVTTALASTGARRGRGGLRRPEPANQDRPEPANQDWPGPGGAG